MQRLLIKFNGAETKNQRITSTTVAKNLQNIYIKRNSFLKQKKQEIIRRDKKKVKTPVIFKGLSTKMKSSV